MTSPGSVWLNPLGQSGRPVLISRSAGHHRVGTVTAGVGEERLRLSKVSE